MIAGAGIGLIGATVDRLTATGRSGPVTQVRRAPSGLAYPSVPSAIQGMSQHLGAETPDLRADPSETKTHKLSAAERDGPTATRHRTAIVMRGLTGQTAANRKAVTGGDPSGVRYRAASGVWYRTASGAALPMVCEARQDVVSDAGHHALSKARLDVVSIVRQDEARGPAREKATAPVPIGNGRTTPAHDP